MLFEGDAMSKVVHLSDNAHRQAKEYCSPRSLKMSDWVGMLIEQATQPDAVRPGADSDDLRAPDGSPSLLVPKKRISGYDHVEPQTDDEGTPVYAAPPFWARSDTTH